MDWKAILSKSLSMLQAERRFLIRLTRGKHGINRQELNERLDNPTLPHRRTVCPNEARIAPETSSQPIKQQLALEGGLGMGNSGSDITVR
jgi:hypothetical protein